MNDPETLQKLWEDCTDCLVDADSAETSANDQNNRLVIGKAAEAKSLLAAAPEQLLTDR